MSVSAGDITGAAASNGNGNELLSLATLMADPAAFSDKIKEFVEKGAQANAAIEEMKLGMAAKEALRQAQIALTEAQNRLAVASENAKRILEKAEQESVELRTKAAAHLAAAKSEADGLVSAAQQTSTRIVLEADRVKAEADDLLAMAKQVAEGTEAARKDVEQLQHALATDRAEAAKEVTNARSLINGIRDLAARHAGA